ncbi:MAG: Fic family protein [Holosporaceae bacterium]|jgi:Fic family protein|nr:Fic family protein [Holosporaceae bacterium]
MGFSMYRVGERINNLLGETIEKIYSLIAEIDAVKTSWRITNNIASQILERLTESAIITSSGSSNRIEGNRLSDIEVKSIYQNINIKKFKTRDEQEIAGYIETLQFVFDNYAEIAISESNILWLHKEMLKYCDKDERHRGTYKIGANRVEVHDPSGNVVGVVFDPTPPHLVRKEMSELIHWYNDAISRKHPLIITANFISEYLAIHPFQDGNGRISRLLSNLMLLLGGYQFTKITSHEQIIEANKAEYYKVLNYTQKTWKTEHEDVSEWILFFLTVVKIQAQKVVDIMNRDNFEQLLSEKQLMVWNYILSLNGGEFSRKDVIAATNAPAITVESIIKKFLNMNKITKLGQGRATRYKKIIV